MEDAGASRRAPVVTYDVEINGRIRRVEIDRTGGRLFVSVEGRRRAADVTVINGVWSLILCSDASGEGSRRSYEVAVVAQPAASGALEVHVGGRLVPVTAGLHNPRARRGREAAATASGNTAPQQVTAPMPGKVVKLLVRTGETVAARQGVIVVEAMKMENELRAPKAGTVAEIKVAEGMSVEAGAVLAIIE
jgi:biotin carboxyl carrier protein